MQLLTNTIVRARCRNEPTRCEGDRRHHHHHHHHLYHPHARKATSMMLLWHSAHNGSRVADYARTDEARYAPCDSDTSKAFAGVRNFQSQRPETHEAFGFACFHLIFILMNGISTSSPLSIYDTCASSTMYFCFSLSSTFATFLMRSVILDARRSAAFFFGMLNE